MNTLVNDRIFYNPSFILVVDVNGITRSVNLAHITKFKIGDWPTAPSQKELKNCIIIEINQTYSIACKKKDNEGLFEYLQSFIVKDFRSKKLSTEETFDEKGGIIW